MTRIALFCNLTNEFIVVFRSISPPFLNGWYATPKLRTKLFFFFIFVTSLTKRLSTCVFLLLGLNHGLILIYVQLIFFILKRYIFVYKSFKVMWYVLLLMVSTYSRHIYMSTALASACSVTIYYTGSEFLWIVLHGLSGWKSISMYTCGCSGRSLNHHCRRQ